MLIGKKVIVMAPYHLSYELLFFSRMMFILRIDSKFIALEL